METIGFLGLGVMGGTIARQIVSKGVKLIVFDPSAEATERLRALGATVASSPRDVADQAEMVLACLPSPEICREVALGEDGVVKGKRVRTYVEISTMGAGASAALTRDLAEHGIEMLDSPISGAVVKAAKGELTAIVAGPDALVARCRPILDCYTTEFFHVGKQQGLAQLSKLINNAMSIFNLVITFEGLAVAKKAGLDLRNLNDLVNVSTGMSFTTQSILPVSLLSDHPMTIGRIGILLKDIHLYMAEAAAMGLSLPAGTWLKTLCERAGADPDVDVPTALIDYFSAAIEG